MPNVRSLDPGTHVFATVTGWGVDPKSSHCCILTAVSRLSRRTDLIGDAGVIYPT